eukprot:1363550-Prymnesium_polylepis.1
MESHAPMPFAWSCGRQGGRHRALTEVAVGGRAREHGTSAGGRRWPSAGGMCVCGRGGHGHTAASLAYR